MENLIDYIKPELAVVAVILGVLGALIKHTGMIKDKYIPLALGCAGIFMAFIWVVGTTELAAPQDWLMAVFTGIVQGILCAGAAVYGHQLVKQLKKEE